MNIGNIIKFDSGNARGLSVVVFCSGCHHHCYHCHNPETWDANYGVSLVEKMDEIRESLNNKHIKNLVLSGGDPFAPENLKGTLYILEETKNIIKENNQEVICYTGYTLKELTERKDSRLIFEIFKYLDYIIDGKYIEELKTPILDYRGSTNQKCWKKGELGWFDFSDMYFRTKGNDNYETT